MYKGNEKRIRNFSGRNMKEKSTYES